MDYTRREFIGMVSAAAALTGVACGAEESGGSADALAGDDPLGIRPDFPVVSEGIYLNSPYITPSPRQAIEAAQAFLEAKARDPISLGNMLGETTAARQKYAQLIGASEAEVSMLFATSDGENVVTRALDLKQGDNVVIDDLHYTTTYVLYSHLRKTRGIDLRIVKNKDGAATPEAFAELVDDRTRLISVSWISHVNGYHHDLKALADLAHAHNAYLYADSIQGTGVVTLDARATGIDFFTSGTYKWLLGGYGVAPFYVREELMDLITPDRLGGLSVANKLENHEFELHSDARKHIYATLGFGSVFQLSAALDYLLKVGVENIERHTVALAHRIHQGLTDQGYRVNTPAGNRSAIVAFWHDNEVEKVKTAMEAARIKFSFREDNTQIRVGPALFNNGSEIDRFLEITGSLA